MAKAVGIDLATTNSVVATVIEGGRAEVIPNEADRERFTVSASGVVVIAKGARVEA